MRLPESAENYLETIYMISIKKNPVRSIDIANELDFSKPSISIAMKNLRENGYIEINSSGHITLTNTGREIAQKMYDRHVLISNWLISLGVSQETAISDACKMEHDISEESFLAIQKYIMDTHSN